MAARICKCTMWEENWKDIGHAILMWYTRMGEFNSAPFEFCPWCGNRMEVKE